MTRETTPMIDVENVAVSLGGTPILDSVSFSVPAQSFVALVGPNGAGKTTLLRTINGVLTPDSGTVSIDGNDVRSLSRRAAARLVATVPQDTTISFEFSVRDVVAMGRTPHRSRFQRADDDDSVERALRRAHISHLADRSAGSVSGGERQRVLLARALAQDAPALVLDEPTASLDITHQVRTQNSFVIWSTRARQLLQRSTISISQHAFVIQSSSSRTAVCLQPVPLNLSSPNPLSRKRSVAALTSIDTRLRNHQQSQRSERVRANENTNTDKNENSSKRIV
ncbi:ABC transporter ATP-binding protein [Halocatena marina]|uniref:ABC transporter ATP-binding protein n=1 Tax=Halocatena marina TaxID=2934937 RepID=A0ABD5YP32_9EURY